MPQGLENILFSELKLNQHYFHRLIHSQTLLEIKNHNKISTLLNRVIKESHELLTTEFKLNLPSPLSEYSFLQTKKIIENYYNIILTIVDLNEDIEEDFCLAVTHFLNTLYFSWQQLHIQIHTLANIQIELPRKILAEIIEETSSSIPLFKLHEQALFSIITKSEADIFSFAKKQEEKEIDFLQMAHRLMNEHNYRQAIFYFQKAIDFNPSASNYTLIAWANSAAGEIETAKSFYFKAIQKDPDFGAPYNDLGTLCLQEERYAIALSWFEKAKKASNYQNREFPYINSGRAYLGLNQPEEALKEFKKATHFAPLNRDLQETILKIEQTIARIKRHEHITP